MLPYLTALVPLAPVEHIPQSEASAPKFDNIFEQILFSLHTVWEKVKTSNLNLDNETSFLLLFFLSKKSNKAPYPDYEK